MTEWEAILRLFEEKRLKKVDFSKKMEISRQTLDNWINKKSVPDQNDFKKMSKVLDELGVKVTGSSIPIYGQKSVQDLVAELKNAYEKASESKDYIIKMQEEKIKELKEALDQCRASKSKS